MARNIFTVSAYIVDANGTKNYLSGYPKDFDSRNYQDDVAKARKRADGDFSEVWGAFCKRDDRQIQTVTLTNVFGELLDRKCIDMTPQPEPEPEPNEAE
jgi:hypothetical protein